MLTLSSSKRLHLRVIFPLMLAFCFLGMLGAACVTARPVIPVSGETSLRVVIDNNYPPYSFLDEEGNLQGILIDRWHLWEKKTGIKVEITGLDWASALREMESGHYDVIDTLFKTAAREKIYDLQGMRSSQATDLAEMEALAHQLPPRQQAQIALQRAGYEWTMGSC